VLLTHANPKAGRELGETLATGSVLARQPALNLFGDWSWR